MHKVSQGEKEGQMSTAPMCQPKTRTGGLLHLALENGHVDIARMLV